MDVQSFATNIVHVDVGLIKPHPLNANKHSKEQIERLAKIIKYSGFRQPLVVSNQTGLLISGHGRLEAAKQLGMTQVPVIYEDFADEAMEFQHLTADNAIASWAELDLDKIKADALDLKLDANGFDLDLLGIPDLDLSVPDPSKEAIEDDVPEATQSISVLGDIYELGEHRLMCGDCLIPENLAKLFGEERAQVWASDPPYGINHVEVANEKGQAKGYKAIANDEKQDEELREFIFKSISVSLPFMKKGFAFYMWHAMKMQAYFSQAAAAAAGILFHRQIIWVKPQFVFGRGQYHWRHELCLMGWLKGNEPPFYGEKNQSTVWELGRENDKIHPTQKPVAIWEPSILNHSKPGEVIYEPFSGSGSNIIACEKTKRRCFAFELEPHYVDVAVARWCKYSGKTSIKRNGEPMEWTI